tara:strand:+ start:214 stop:471 length:258 start_codon:yes stop_codon:yes gene_type:complete
MILIKILPAVLLAIIAAAVPLVTGWFAIDLLKEFNPGIAALWVAYLAYVFLGLAIVTLFAEMVERRYRQIMNDLWRAGEWNKWQP